MEVVVEVEVDVDVDAIRGCIGFCIISKYRLG